MRLISVLNTRLDGRAFLAGKYSIADMATYPWVAAGWPVFQRMLPDQVGAYGNVQRWLDTMAQRPGVQRGMAVPAV